MSSRQPPPQPPADVPPAAENGSGPAAGSRTQRRRLGPRAALNRARTLRNSKELTPAQDALLRVTGRLLVHLENLSGRLYELGELRADDEPRAALAKLLDLEATISRNLKTLGLLEDSADDPLSALMAGQHR